MTVVFCDHCGRQSEMVSINEAGRFVGLTRRTIHAWIKMSRLHLIRLASGRILICKASLLMPPRREAVAAR